MRQRLRKKVFNNNPRRIVCGDLHLTDNSKDEYRWRFLDWLYLELQEYNADYLYILGDICERKDHHSAKLVNRVIQELIRLSEICQIVILKGNHDFDKDEGNPFFDFTNAFKGIEFITEVVSSKDNELFIPFTLNTKELLNIVDDISIYDFVYMHVDIIGADAGNGYKLENGLNIKNLKNIKTNFMSGHIHNPQTMSDNFTYIGAPYPIRFGDNYTGSIYFIDANNQVSAKPYQTLKKYNLSINSIHELDALNFKKEDQVKLIMELSPSEFCEWNKLRNKVKEYFDKKEVDLFSIEMRPINVKTDKKEVIINNEDVSPKELLKNFCKKENLGRKQLNTGIGLL